MYMLPINNIMAHVSQQMYEGYIYKQPPHQKKKKTSGKAAPGAGVFAGSADDPDGVASGGKSQEAPPLTRGGRSSWRR